MQTAVVLTAFEIVEADEGGQRRRQLTTNVLTLRGQMHEQSLQAYGDPSAIVAVKVGAETVAHLVSRRRPEMDLLANLVEYPAVPKGAARFRLQVMAGHLSEDIAHAADCIKRAVDAANDALSGLDADVFVRSAA